MLKYLFWPFASWYNNLLACRTGQIKIHGCVLNGLVSCINMLHKHAALAEEWVLHCTVACLSVHFRLSILVGAVLRYASWFPAAILRGFKDYSSHCKQCWSGIKSDQYSVVFCLMHRCRCWSTNSAPGPSGACPGCPCLLGILNVAGFTLSST